MISLARDLYGQATAAAAFSFEQDLSRAVGRARLAARHFGERPLASANRPIVRPAKAFDLLRGGCGLPTRPPSAFAARGRRSRVAARIRPSPVSRRKKTPPPPPAGPPH